MHLTKAGWPQKSAKGLSVRMEIPRASIDAANTAFAGVEDFSARLGLRRSRNRHPRRLWAPRKPSLALKATLRSFVAKWIGDSAFLRASARSA